MLTRNECVSLPSLARPAGASQACLNAFVLTIYVRFRTHCLCQRFVFQSLWQPERGLINMILMQLSDHLLIL